MRALLRAIWTLLRQIADENAYQHYLKTEGRAHSGEEWRRFCDQHFARKYARSKCC
jgi:hypothetical protein